MTVVLPEIESPAGGQAKTTAWLELLKRHRLFAVVMFAAAALRVLTMLSLRPAELYWYDSFEYLKFALDPIPIRELHPGGYGLFLWALKPFHSITLVVALQHVMGLAVGLLVYAVLRRRSVHVWVAVLATIPALFDVELLHLEHAVLSDAPFTFLMVAAVAVLLWSPTISWRAGAAAGFLFALAALARTLALPVLILVLGWMAVRRVGLRPLIAATVAAAIPLVMYAGWYSSEYGQFKLVGGDGAALWARTRTFANCAVIKPPADEARLCPDGIQEDTASEYFWAGEINRPPFRAANEELARSFAIHAILAQPLDYLHDVVHDVSLSFAWPAVAHPKRLLPVYYFDETEPPSSNQPDARKIVMAYDPGWPDRHMVRPYSSFLMAYRVHLPGPLLGFILLAGAVGLFRRGRAPGARRNVLLAWGVAVTLLVFPVAVLDFDHRYVMPVLPFACLAAALAFSRPARAPGPENPAPVPTAQ
jgi:hypothetical protein